MSKKVTSRRTRKGVGDSLLVETLDAFARPALSVLGEEPSVIDEDVSRQIQAKVELSSIFKPRRASAWRNLGAALRVQYFQLALLNSGAWAPEICPRAASRTIAALPRSPLYQATAYTLNLAPAVQRSAMDWAKGPADYFRRRISRRLPRIPFYVACEFDEGRLHLHGGIGYALNSEERVRAALKAVGGPYHADFEEWTLRLVAIYDPVTWANYAGKDIGRTTRRLNANPIATTHPVVREARRIHALHRAMLVPEQNAH